MKRSIATLILIFIILGSESVYATTFNVTSSSNTGPASLRRAIRDGNNSGDNHIINILVSGPIVITSDQRLMTKNFIINGNGHTIDGNGFRAISIAGTTVTINNLTITNCDGSDGGAISTTAGTTLNLNNCLLDGNSSTGDGGAIVNRGTLNIDSSIISNNIAGMDGGAITTNGGLVTITQSLLLLNEAGDDGGAAVINSGNTGQGEILIINSTLSQNKAVDGGAIRITNGILTLQNVTVAENMATDVGGGIVLNSPSSLTLDHTIIAKNMASEGPDIRTFSISPVSNGYNVIGNTSISNFIPTTGDVIDTDARLNPLADNGGPTMTYRLILGSPALDIGGPCQQIDQRGVVRSDGQCDAGAFEGEPTIPIPTLSQWSIIVLSLIFLLFGIGFIKYRNPLLKRT